jgi:hypothetical protein
VLVPVLVAVAEEDPDEVADDDAEADAAADCDADDPDDFEEPQAATVSADSTARHDIGIRRCESKAAQSTRASTGGLITGPSGQACPAPPDA